MTQLGLFGGECDYAADRVARRRAYQRQYRLENSERIKDVYQRWRKQNAEQIKAKNREKYLQHREEMIERSRVYYANNRATRIAYANQWADENPERMRSYRQISNKRAWADPERRAKLSERHAAWQKALRSTDEGKRLLIDRAKKFRLSKETDADWKAKEALRRRRWYKQTINTRRMCARVKAHKRRVLVKSAGNHTEQDIALLQQQQGNKCAACHRSLWRAFHIDHIMPVSLGGSNAIDNLELLCPRCNRSKGNKHPDKWAAKLNRLFV